MSELNTVGILLAAGIGRRFDPTGSKNKLTQILANGAPVAIQAARNLLGAVTQVIAVVRCEKLELQLGALGCEAYFFSQAQCGIGASLAFAMRHIADSTAHVDSVLVALADMPYIQTGTSQKVVAALAAGADIAQPTYQQQSGHPIGFSRRHFPALTALNSDIGARHLLQKFSVHQVTVDDAGILRDIDFLSDL